MCEEQEYGDLEKELLNTVNLNVEGVQRLDDVRIVRGMSFVCVSL